MTHKHYKKTNKIGEGLEDKRKKKEIVVIAKKPQGIEEERIPELLHVSILQATNRAASIFVCKSLVS